MFESLLYYALLGLVVALCLPFMLINLILIIVASPVLMIIKMAYDILERKNRGK